MTETSLSWTDERVELLSKLWGEGLSASQIATALGGGVTRNAVIGKVHRLGLSGRAKAGAPAPQRAVKPRAPGDTPGQDGTESPTPATAAPVSVPVAVPMREQAPSPVVAIPVSQRVSILELRDSMCRWPIGDPSKPDFAFCGGRAATGLPYCADHCRIAYQPAAERKRIRA